MNASPRPTGSSAGTQRTTTSTSARVSRTTSLSRRPSRLRGLCSPGVSTRTSCPPGGRGAVIDYVVQEIDLATRDVLFEWHSLDHVPLRASMAARAAGEKNWDYFHGNSSEPSPDGRTVVVSARNPSAIYGIDRVTGDVLWTLGGREDDFRLQTRHRKLRFCAQHDARWTPS